MAEEHGFQSPEGHRLCANNCGFFGSPATQNFCSKCYGDICMKEDQAKSAKSAVENSLFPPPPAEVPSCSAAASLPMIADEAPVPAEEPVVLTVDSGPDVARPNRCTVCRKRTGLMGFRCRCGTTFCGTHRYPEQHRCTFDFKAAGREAIAKANPVVKAEKLEKI